MNSTANQPLKYFEDVSRKTLKELIKDFIIEWNNDGYSLPTESIDEEKGIITVKHDYLPEGTSKPKNGLATIEFAHNFKSDLKKELIKTIDFIDEYIVNNVNDYLTFINIQKNTLQYIVNSKSNLIYDFPDFLNTINELVEYINNKYLSDQPNQIELILPTYYIYENEQNGNQSNISNDDILLQNVLGYLKGKNDKREQIMSDADYNKMLGYVKYYIQNQELPASIDKIEEVNISQNLLRFTFWVLHKKLYTTNSIREDFVLLLKEMFSKFDNTEFDVLKTKFGSREKVTVQGKKYIPEMIKYERRNK